MVYRVEYIFGDVKFVDDVREIKSLIDSVLSTERGAIRSVKYSPSILDRITNVALFKRDDIPVCYNIFYNTGENFYGINSSEDVVSSIDEILNRGYKILSIEINRRSITTEHGTINTDKIDSNL